MLVLGVIFSGEHYKALAIVSTISFLRENNNFKYCYYVSDSKSTDFETCVTLVIPGIKFTWVAPPETDFSLYKFPKYAGNYVTYWSLELLDFVDKEDVLVFIDSDTYTRRKLPIEEICSSLKEKKYPFAAVAVPRAVHERWIALQLKTPFHVINGGFFIYLPTFDESSSIDNYSEVSKLLALDPLNLIFADQDILNFRFRHNTLLLSSEYNVTTTIMQTFYRGRVGLNSLYLSSVVSNPIMVHFVGNSLTSTSFPPNKFTVEYRRNLNSLRKIGKLKQSLGGLSLKLLRPYFSINNILSVIFGTFYIHEARLFSLKEVVRILFLKK
jgi:lipopolysaccharide biosynthesis glycosyltransferase